MAIQSTGVGSGLDVNSIITQLMAIESRPLTRLQTVASTTQTQLSSYGALKSRITALGDAAAKLASAATWNKTKATSSDADVLSVSSSDTAAPVNLQIEVSQLARAQSVSSSRLATPADVVGTGTLTIEFGSWSDTFAAFTPKVPASSATITIGTGEDTLAGVRDKINAANAGVSATILNDSSGSRLVLRSTVTGAESGFRLSVSDADTNNLDDSGLSRLAFDPPAGAPAAGNQRGVDLVATVNGAAIVSASNKLDNLVDGVSVQVHRATTDPVEATVALDTDAMKVLIEGFVKAYNDANQYLADQTRYNAEAKTAATLQGDRTAVGLQGQLRSLVATQSNASAVFGTLSSIGITLERDGSLKVNEDKLGRSLSNLPELARLFGGDSATDPTSVGIARRFDVLADANTNTGGALDSREEGLRQRLERNKDEQERFNDRLARTEARLRAQYTALDNKMSQLNGLSAYVTQQMEMLNASTISINKD
ncbi:MAG TPA: flagellar filament capping protein FliD [Rubrivivax sp.]